MAIDLIEIVEYLNNYLSSSSIKDYCPNGLQIEGKTKVNKIVTGVTASQALIDAAIERDADAILVHHGYFWKGEPEVLTGIKGNRIRSLMKADMSLIAYHLPLDMHSELGNNAQLADLLNIEVVQTIDAENSKVPGLIGKLNSPMPAKAFSQVLTEKLNQEPIHIGDDNKVIETIAWCTGAAQGYISYAIDQQIDAYLTGEINEPAVHIARESGVNYYAAGHHATERYGVKALGEHLSKQFKIEVEFVDIPNPV